MLQKLKQLFSKVKRFILGILNATDKDARVYNPHTGIFTVPDNVPDYVFMSSDVFRSSIDARRGFYTVPESSVYPVSDSFTMADKAPKKKKKKSKKKAKKKTKRSSK